MQDKLYPTQIVNFVSPDSSLPLFNPDTLQINRRACQYPFIQRIRGEAKPIDVQENFNWLMRLLGVQMRYNKMTRRCDTHIPSRAFYHEEQINLQIGAIENIMRINDMSPKNAGAYVLSLSCENAYHPVMEALVEKPWDGTRRWDDFIHIIKAKNAAIAYDLIRLWMMQCIEALMTDQGYIAKGVLILQGLSYAGKTKWFENLSIAHHSVRTENTFNVESKDDRLELTSFWINEIAEIDGSFKRGEPTAALKSYFTTMRDIIRCPYAKASSDFARRTIFGGTTNVDDFLTDATGNRRYWVVAVESIKWDHGLDMQQVWAEVYAHCLAGNKVNISPSFLAAIHKNNLRFDEKDTLAELLMTKLDWSNSERVYKTSTQICQVLLSGLRKINDGDSRRIGRIINKKIREGEEIDMKLRDGYMYYAVPAFAHQGNFKTSSRW